MKQHKIQMKQKQAGQSTGKTINGDKATSWVREREKIQYASTSLHTCLKSKAEMWLASAMRDVTRARQVRIT